MCRRIMKGLICIISLLMVFSVVAFAAPEITSLTPNTANNWGRIEITELAGTGFEQGSIVTLKKEGQPDIVVLTMVESPVKISGRFNAIETQPGTYDVLVTNPDNQSATLTSGFTLTIPPAPVLTASAPALTDNMGIARVELTGENFLEGVEVKLIREGQPDIDALFTMMGSTTKIICEFNLTGVTLGNWAIKVINPDGQTN